MTLKDMMERDVHAVFFNTTEFAEIIKIDSIPYSCIIYEDEFTHETAKTAQLDGVFIQNTHVLIPTVDIKTIPVDGQRVVLRNKPFYVVDVKNEQGVIHLTLSANQS